MSKNIVQLSRWRTIVVHFDKQNKHVNFELNEKERLKDKIIQTKKRSLILSKLLLSKNMENNNQHETNNNTKDENKKEESKLTISEPNIFQYSNIQEIPSYQKKKNSS